MGSEPVQLEEGRCMRAFDFWLLDYSLEHDTYHDQTIYEEPQIEDCVLMKSKLSPFWKVMHT